jgi:putative transposase
MKHYDEPGHAHELTFSCYHRQPYLNDPLLCDLLLDELNQSRQHHHYRLWAYVLMPNHVHLLIWPYNKTYKIADIFQKIKGKASKMYRDIIIKKKPECFEAFCVTRNGEKSFRIWQAGGGFDRNIWNSKPIHHSIEYIEGNPVRADLVEFPEEWKWSSARARIKGGGIVPDRVDIPMYMR